MIYPYIIYQVLEYTFAKNNMIVAVEDKRKNIISKVIFIIITIILAMLISCQFKYGILVIGSGSMTGAINKGDAVFFEQYNAQDEIEIGQVIIFNQDNIKIVHRVIDVKNVNGETRYITKGDANQDNDEGYRTNEDIIGICKFRIAYIGYPSIWIRDIFSK
jgi:signal peptidase